MPPSVSLSCVNVSLLQPLSVYVGLRLELQVGTGIEFCTQLTKAYMAKRHAISCY